MKSSLHINIEKEKYQIETFGKEGFSIY